MTDGLTVLLMAVMMLMLMLMLMLLVMMLMLNVNIGLGVDVNVVEDDGVDVDCWLLTVDCWLLLLLLLLMINMMMIVIVMGGDVTWWWLAVFSTCEFRLDACVLQDMPFDFTYWILSASSCQLSYFTSQAYRQPTDTSGLMFCVGRFDFLICFYFSVSVEFIPHSTVR